MPITEIQRDWGNNPSIVRIVTTDTFATITTPGYLTAQAANIAALNHGVFQWVSTDYVLIAYAGGEAFFLPDFTVNFTFLPTNTNAYIKTFMTSAQWIAMYAAPFQILPAPGANSVITVHSAIVEMAFVAAQYQLGGAVALQLNNTIHGGGILETATVAGATVDGWAADSLIKVAGVLGNNAVANVVNQPLYISNDTAAFAVGDGTFNIHTWYSIFSTIP